MEPRTAGAPRRKPPDASPRYPSFYFPRSRRPAALRAVLATIRYRQLANTMDERFPDATEEELAACEHTCIICRDHMDAGKKLPCSHIFHFQ